MKSDLPAAPSATVPGETVPAVLKAAARSWPDAEAVVEGETRVSFAGLESMVAAAAAALRAAGVNKGDTVALWAPNSLRWIVLQLAAAAAGVVLVPLNTRFKGPEAAYVLNRSRASLLVTTCDFLGRDYRDLLAGEHLPHLREAVLLEEWEGFVARGGGSSGDCPGGLPVAAEDWLDLMFTSGTTGKPKGVRSRHGVTVRSYRFYAENLGLRAGDRYLLANPLFHTFGSKAGVVASLLAGATVYPVPVFDPSAAAELIGRERITVFPGPPTVYHSLLALADEDKRGLRSLRLAVTGAAAVPVELLRRMREELGFEVVLTAYGLTETAGLVTMCRAGDPPEVVASTSGRPIPGVEVKTVRPDGSETAPGEAGEVLVRGYPVMDGYFEDPAATAEVLDGEGWLRTGDVGLLDASGGLRITDRIKDMFIVGGFNAYPAEIEATLVEAPGVAQAAVVGVPDERLGEVGRAFVVPRPGEEVDEAAVIAFARRRLANYKVPRSVVVVDSLPVNAGGKVMKHLLREGSWTT